MPYLFIGYLGAVLLVGVGCLYLMLKREKGEPKPIGNPAEKGISRRAMWHADCARRLREQM